jgi:hypothetical protein
LPARGVKVDILEMEEHLIKEYSIQVTMRNRITNLRCNVVAVYGPAQHEFSSDFLLELSTMCGQWGLPLVISGDFSLIRHKSEKNTDNFNPVDLFNYFIGDHHLRACLGISGMNGNEGYWGGGISIISQNFPKSPSILFHPLDSSISQTSQGDGQN